MSMHIGTDDMRKKLGEILDCVYVRGDEFIIHHKNKSLAALVPAEKWIALKKASKEFLIEFMQQQPDRLTQKEADALIGEAKQLVRKKKK